MIYDLAPGVCIETSSDDPAGGRHVLSERQLDKARDEYAAKPTRKTLEAIAARHKAVVYAGPRDTRDPGATQLAVDLNGLISAVGLEQAAELAQIEPELLDRLAGQK